MALFNNSQTPAQQAAATIKRLASQQYQQLGFSGTQGYNLIWNNRNASPQDVIAALGTDAEAIFELADLNVSTINAAATIGGITAPNVPSSLPAGYVVSFNEDGSANVTQSSSSSSSSS